MSQEKNDTRKIDKDISKETNAKSGKKRQGGKKKRGFGAFLLDFLIVALIGVAIFSGYKIVSQLAEDKEGEDAYDDIASYAHPETVIVTVPAPAAQESQSDEPGVPEETAEQIVVKQFDWAALLEENADCVGWLECEGTVINYPVVQGKNNKYYLNHLFNGEQQRYGTLFVDAENTPGFVDANTIIYGHHLKNGKMFGSIKKYKNGDKYYQEHPIFMLYTPEHAYRVELFANALVDGSKGIPMSFATKEDFQAWIDKMYKLSTFKSDVVMTTEDRMVTLYTCSYDYDSQRQLLVGKLVQLT